MEPDYAVLVPSVLLWTIILITYASFSLVTVHTAIRNREDIPIWTWPAIFLAGLVVLGILGMVMFSLAYPFYYFLYL